MLPRNSGYIWALFFPLLAFGSYVGFIIASRMQGKKMSMQYLVLLGIGHILLVMLIIWGITTLPPRGS